MFTYLLQLFQIFKGAKEEKEKTDKREADASLWPAHSGLDNPFAALKAGKPHYESAKPHYETPYHKPVVHSYNPTTPPPPPVHCEYKPTEKCKYVTKEVCKPEETEKNEEVCVEIPTQKAEKVCKEKLRMECEVVEKPDRRIECDISPIGKTSFWFKISLLDINYPIIS